MRAISVPLSQHYFCGHDYDCGRLGDRAALAAAKLNIERSFAVVAILDEFETSLEVLEAELPRYFAGARRAYWASQNGNGIASFLR